MQKPSGSIKLILTKLTCNDCKMYWLHTTIYKLVARYSGMTNLSTTKSLSQNSQYRCTGDSSKHSTYMSPLLPTNWNYLISIHPTSPDSTNWMTKKHFRVICIFENLHDKSFTSFYALHFEDFAQTQRSEQLTSRVEFFLQRSTLRR